MKLQLASNLRKLIKEHDLTVAQLSRATKIPAQTVNNWLAGLEPRSMSQVKTVATYFEKSLDELAYGENRNQPKTEPFKEHQDEINAGIYEVILRKPKGNK